MRNITEKAKAYRIANDEFYSGPTLERPNKESSKDKVISYGKNAQRARRIPVLPKVYNTGYGEMVRTVNNRCETCGRNNHTRESCRLFGNPMAINSSTKWQFSQLGKSWQAIGLHKWTLGRHVRGYGLAQYNADIPIPKNHVYPDEQNQNHESRFKEIQPKHNAWYAQHRAEQQNKYNRNKSNNNNENTHYHANNEIPNQDNKRPRSECKQYVFALLNPS